MSQPLSESQIASLALKLCADKGIASLADNSPSASLMNDLYPISRDLLQSVKYWKFLINRITLNQLSTVPLTVGSVNTTISQRKELPNKFAYALPSNYLRMVETGNDPNPYKIENIVTNVQSGASQPCVISDDGSLIIRYTARIVDTSQFTPHFAWALVCFLAYNGAIPVTGSLAKKKSMKEDFIMAIQDARMVDSFEGSEDVMISDVLTDQVR